MHAILLTTILTAATGSVQPSTRAISQKHSPTDPTLQIKEASNSARFELRKGAQNSAWLEERFHETLWQNDAVLRDLNGQNPRSLAEYLRSSDYSTVKQVLALSGSWKSGNAVHTWVFDEPDQPNGLITRALELEDFSGPSGYYVRVTVHCYDELVYCKPYRDRQTGLLAPKPATTAGDLALQQWQSRVMSETCNVFARNMSDPHYPTLALREGIEGTVQVGIVFNSCGNVRDAWVQKSSGSLELDRAAVRQVLKWQIDTQSLPKNVRETGRSVVPIRFMLGDEPSTTSSTTQ